MGRRQRGGAWAVLAALVGLTALGGYVAERTAEGPSCSVRTAAVVLDPGHGGDDPGAINQNAGLVESDLTVAIARRVAELLRSDGITVALTRDGEATLGNSERGLIANACRARVYVSIHLNSFGEPEPNYVKTFWGIAGKDLAFAQAMQAVLVAELRPGTNLDDGGVEQLENGALIRAQMPAILVESVFQSNPEEAARLASPDGARLNQIARAIAGGIEGWLGVAVSADPSAPVGVEGDAFMRASDPLLAPARGTPAQVLAAAEAAGAQRLPELRAYVEEVYRLAPLVGLDPSIVVAQSAHETGFWRSSAWADHLNPAGIGVTGPEVTSPTWSSGADAARAQIVHLYLYAAGEVEPEHILAPYLPLDPRYAAALAAGRAASARTLADLTGSWAVDPAYAELIARVGDELFGGA